MKLLKFGMNDRGQLSFSLVFLLSFIILVVIFAVMIPLGTTFITGMYQGGEDILTQANDTAQLIQDDSVRENVTSLITSATTATTENVSILTSAYKYGWVLILFIIAVMIALRARLIVEYNQGRLA